MSRADFPTTARGHNLAPQLTGQSPNEHHAELLHRAETFRAGGPPKLLLLGWGCCLVPKAISCRRGFFAGVGLSQHGGRAQCGFGFKVWFTWSGSRAMSVSPTSAVFS